MWYVLIGDQQCMHTGELSRTYVYLYMHVQCNYMTVLVVNEVSYFKRSCTK